MNVSRSLASRLGTGGSQRSRARPSNSQYVRPKVGEALARRLGVSVTVDSSVSVGIKARLGLVKGRNQHFTSSQDLDARRRSDRADALFTRRGLGGSNEPSMVQMASGRMVGGMRSDNISKSPRRTALRPPSPQPGTPIVEMDADRGLTVSLPNKGRRHSFSPPSAPRRRRRSPSPAARRAGGNNNNYSQHDDRTDTGPRGTALHSDWDESEDDVGLRVKGGQHRYDRRSMEDDGSVSGDVYSASLQFTRTTTHHHHHHHLAPSPPPPSSRHIQQQYRRLSSPPVRVRYADPYPLQPPAQYVQEVVYPRRAAVARRSSPPGEVYSPPPSPPSFHPRQPHYPQSSARVHSPPPPPAARYKVRSAPVPAAAVRSKTKPSSSRVVAKSSLKTVKSGKVVKKAKPVKLVKKTVKKLKKGKGVRAESPASVSSDSDSSSSSSSTGSASSSSVAYRPPKERVLPQPHKQTLDPKVLDSIAMLQGKQPGYKSGPGPGVKNLVFVPSRTARSLNQRFTTVDAAR